MTPFQKYIEYCKILGTVQYKKILHSLPFSKNQSYTPFVVLCHPRTGSTLVHTYLNAHPAIQSLGETLKNVSSSKDLSQHLNQRIFKAYPSGIQAVGFKVFYEYKDTDALGKSFYYLLQKKDLHVIHLHRENILQTLVSLKIAEKTQIWSANFLQNKQEPDIIQKRVYLDATSILTQLEKIEADFFYFSRFFSEKKCLTITYEELVKNPVNTLNKAQAFLRVKKRRLYSLLKKQNIEPLIQLIENYEEIEDVLKGTKWQHCLE